MTHNEEIQTAIEALTSIAFFQKHHGITKPTTRHIQQVIDVLLVHGGDKKIGPSSIIFHIADAISKTYLGHPVAIRPGEHKQTGEDKVITDIRD